MDTAFIGDSSLIMGLLFADMLHGEIASYLKTLTSDDLMVIACHAHDCEASNLSLLNAIEAEGGIPLSSATWWSLEVLPTIARECTRRSTPERIYDNNGSGSPIARFKATHRIEVVAARYTQLHQCAPNKLKGHCPIHQEQTASFYIYEDTQKYYCFGACASGGDVIDLLRALGEDIHW